MKLWILALVLGSFFIPRARAAVPVETENFASLVFNDDTVRALKEPWYLVWGEFYFPHDADLRADATLAPYKSFMDLPPLEKEGYPLTPQGGLGAATYFRVLKGLTPLTQGYDLSMLPLSSAYKACVYPLDKPQDLQCVSSGKPGLDEASTVPQITNQTMTFHPDSAEQSWVFLIHVSNFHTFTGGLRYGPPELGLGGRLHRLRDHERYYSYFVMGFLGAIFAYSFMLWARHREDWASLALSAFGFVTMLRMFFTTHVIYSYVNNSIGLFEIKFAVEYGALVISSWAYIFFIHTAFREASFPRIFKALGYLAMPLVAAVCVVKPVIFTRYLLSFQIYILLASAFGLTVLVRSFRMRIEGSVVAVTGAFIVVITAVWDIMIARGMAPYPFISQFGISFFMFLQGQVIAGRFARAFRTAEHLSLKLQDEVDRQVAEIRERTAEIQSVMENIPEGIVYVISDDGHLSRVRSQFLNQIFGRGHERHKLADLLESTRLDANQQAQVLSVVSASLGEDRLTWEANAELLPRSVFVRNAEADRIVDFGWHPIYSEDDTITKILVTAHDVTAFQALERKAQEKAVEALRMNEIIGNRRFLLARFFRSSEEIMAVVNRSGATELKTLYGSLHTLKGMARTLNLSELAATVHEAEEPLFLFLRQHKGVIDAKILGAHIEAVRTSYQHYRDIYENIKREWEDHPVGRTLNMAKDFIRAILEPELNLAASLGKEKPTMDIQAEAVELNDDQSNLLQMTFVHLMRNALDHGLEKAEERQKNGKKPAGQVSVHLTRGGQGLIFEFFDDGRGLNLGQLRQRAQKLGLLQGQEEAEAVVATLFKEGFSSREDVSDISGRGVGMGEVKRLIELAGGMIQLLPRDFASWSAAAGSAASALRFLVRIELPNVKRVDAAS